MNRPHPPSHDDAPASGFRIGTVSRLTGIATETLRIWERRYQVVNPDRRGGTSRLYAREDIERLTLLKLLVDRGVAIGSIARLDDAQLRERAALLGRDAGTATAALATGRPLAVAVMGEVLPLRLRHEPIGEDWLTITSACRGPVEFEAALGGTKPDVVVLEYAAVHRETAREIRRLVRYSGARRAIVVYGFAAHDALALLDEPAFSLVRAPLAPDDLRRECRRLAQAATAAPPDAGAPRIFSDEALALVATTANAKVLQCECPRHLSDLILKLTQFEQYSADCENRNADDAALHALLRTASGRARSLLEAALERLLEVENMDLETLRRGGRRAGEPA